MCRFALQLALAAACALAGVGSAGAQSEYREPFEGPEATWQETGADVRYVVDAHARVRGPVRSGEWSERIKIKAESGSRVLFSHDVGQARVISELAVSAWIKADRPGLQLMARVVLPRTIDPRSGQPAVVYISGSGYTRVGTWQQLQLRDAPPLVEREARVLRAQLRRDVDVREAYVDRAVLNVYGGPGATELWIDDLEVSPLIGRRPAATTANATGNRGAQSAPVSLEPRGGGAGSTADRSTLRTPPARGDVKLAGQTLTIDGKPFVPRVIEHQGEPLAALAALGFTAARTRGAANPALRQEAAACGMWLFSPPPTANELTVGAGASASAPLGGQFDRVLAWQLGRDLATRELQATENWARLVGAADPLRRPIVCDPLTDLRAYSRHVDVLVASRTPLGTSLQIADYLQWLQQRPQFARSGTPIWATVQTQPAPALVEQAQGLAPGVELGGYGHDQILQLVYAAMAAGARGLIFDSHAPLDSPDPATRRRALALARVNLELELIEPWISGGSFVTTATSSDANVTALVLQTQRTRLLLPLTATPYSQIVSGGPAADTISLVVPGVPESSDPYALSPVELRRLPHTRATGGIRLVLGPGEFGPVVLTQDPLVLRELSRSIGKLRRRAAELESELAVGEVALAESIASQLAQLGRLPPQAKPLVQKARAAVTQCSLALAAGDAVAAYGQARRAALVAQRFERACWNAAGENSLANPLAASFHSLPRYWQWQAQLAATSSAGNRLSGGDFEDLQSLLRAGWRHFQHAQPGTTTDVALAPEAAHSGRLGLQLRVAAEKPGETTIALESPPLWVSSPPVPLVPGQVVRIHGWVYVPQPIAGSVDGLLVLDSLAGEPLALRIKQTRTWQEFELFRAAPRGGDLSLTFALTGLGEARIDDVTVEPLQAPSPGNPAR